TQVATQPLPGANVVVNAEGARSVGFEADFTANLSERLRMGGALGYADAEIVADTISATGVIPEGSPLAHAPLWSGSTFIEYAHPLSTGDELRLRVDARYTGERQNSVDVVGQPGTPLDDYTIVNALAAYQADAWSLNFYVNNLTNELAELNALMFGDPLIGDVVAGYVRNRPRTAGVQLRVEF
ncbi:MAG TPA: TonB-dependent receptor, partial [Verrucomicrobiae bacterium]|nr:TonB-dependent receptor [Verrucomicrobiae bacterium]